MARHFSTVLHRVGQEVRKSEVRDATLDGVKAWSPDPLTTLPCHWEGASELGLGSDGTWNLGCQLEHGQSR